MAAVHVQSMSLDELAGFERIVVVDLEATCSNDGAVPHHEMETIEIGAVAVDLQSGEQLAEFQSFVEPVRRPRLTVFCMGLTGISQEMVTGAPAFGDAFGALKCWISEFDRPLAFGSWGAFDVKQFRRDCDFHGLEWGLPPHANLKELFSIRQQRKRRYDMATALRLCDIALAGTHHRALDDARNISRLLPWIVGEERLKG